MLSVNLKSEIGQRTRWYLALAIPLILFWASPSSSQDASTTVYIVRHAEKLDNNADSPLAKKGFERAEELSHILQDAGLTAIFVSKRVRTQQTAAPTAKMTGLVPQQYESAETVVSDILSRHIGGHVLVVGHSETVDDIAAGLGVAGVPALSSGQYDRLFLVHRIGDKAHLHTLRFGEPTN